MLAALRIDPELALCDMTAYSAHKGANHGRQNRRVEYRQAHRENRCGEARAQGRDGSAYQRLEARRAGLLDGDKTEHVSFRAPRALVEAAQRLSGMTKPTELGLLALAMLAQPDPTAKFLKETRGKLQGLRNL
jgi:hypothetical protein